VNLTLHAALDTAVVEFRRRLIAVGDGDWAGVTPCPDWDVHYLVAHVVGGNRFASLVLGGATSAEAIELVMGTPQLGAAPVEDFDATAAAQRDGFARAGALECLVGHPIGEVTGEQFLRMRTFDIALHAWDLAVAIGRDVTLDDALVEAVLSILEQQEPGMGIEPCGKVGSDASAMARLLDLSGRCAGALRA
jgi:uncharacterized protein (TIGR03086 family)